MTDPLPPPLPAQDASPELQGRRSVLADLDRLLRGQFTTEQALRSERLAIPLRSLVLGSLALGAFYGSSMGLFSGLNSSDGGSGSWMQVAASAMKVPLLFLLTLLVTFPSLYVVSALSRSTLRTADTMRLLLGGVTVNLALLASLGPVAAFFTLSTDSYPFMKLLHVVFFTVSGFVGLTFLWRALRVILSPAQVDEVSVSAPGPADADGSPAAPLDAEFESIAQRHRSARQEEEAEGQVRRVFQIWILIFGLVGAQMGWILRPFIGAPSAEFGWFRERGSNILLDVLRTIGELLG